MKKVIYISVIVLISTFKSFSQEKSFAVKLNPLSLAFITPNLQFEKSISETSTVQLGLAFANFKVLEQKFGFVQVTPEFRKYFGEEGAMRGFYVGPYLRLISGGYTEGNSDTKIKYNTFGGGAVLGFERATQGGFVFDIFAGPNYGATSFKQNIVEEDVPTRGTGGGFGVRFGIALGFAK